MSIDLASQRLHRVWAHPAWRWLSLAIVAVTVLLLLTGPLLRMPFKVVIDYNEGWNAFHTARAMSGQPPLYDDGNEWTPLEYPPLSFFVVGVVGEAIGDVVLAGRVISFAALLLVAAGVLMAVLMLAGDAWAAIFGAVFCLGIFAAQATHYVGMNDPQMLGHVFMVAGLLLYLTAPTSPRRLFLVALFLTMGLCVKYNLIPIPLAIGLDLLLRSRRRCLLWAGCMALLLGAVGIVCIAVWGPSFLHQLTLNAVTYDYRKAIVTDIDWVLLMQIPLMVAAFWAARALLDARTRVLVFYLAFALGLAFFTLGGTGADVNMLFDAFIGLSLAAALFLSHVRRELQPRLGLSEAMIATLPLFLSVSLVAALPEKAIRPRTIADFQASQADVLADVAFLRAQPGPAICETLLLCYYAGKPFTYDPYNAREMIVRGLRDESVVVEQLQTATYATVQTNHPVPARYFADPPPPTDQPVVSSSARFTENMRRALGLFYEQARQTGNRSFYVPRQPAP